MTAEKRRLTIQQAIEWAFQKEFAQLELPDLREAEDRGFGFGTEYVLLQRLKLGGVKIDVSRGRSYPHEDAESIAAAISNLPGELGGIPMAIRITEMGRSGITPDWMPGAVPKIEAMEWVNRNQYGRQAKAEILRTWYYEAKTPHPKNPGRTISRRIKVDETWCRCTWRPSEQQIRSARQDYCRWWDVLDYLRERVQLRTIEITDAMPPRTPWLNPPRRRRAG